MGSLKVNTRSVMTDYWKSHSDEATDEKMMLDSNAKLLGEQEIPEILSYLGDIDGKDILEVGAGIGRFTGILGKKAKSVIAVDFMENFIEENRKRHGDMKNISFKQKDATKLDLPCNSVDLVFTNWLLMYLEDDEVRRFFQSALSWLREGGLFFMRESCFHKSGNSARDVNPTKYRKPSDYNNLLSSVSWSSEDGKEQFGLELILCKSVDTYVKVKNSRNQLIWVVKKVKKSVAENQGYHNFQQFLDSQQYERNSILAYEKIFGHNYVSTGGKETTEEFVAMLDLKPEQKVLDIGAGIGGSAFYMAEKFGAHVLGMDLSSNMIGIALERAATEYKDTTVQFEISDATKREYEPTSFDVVYSRDTILHIADKAALFSSFLKWLKPGGKLLISDYCCGDREHSEQFKAYVAQRGYHLLSVPNYGKVLESVGFVNVKAEDRTEQFIDVLKRESLKFKAIKDEVSQEFSEKDYERILKGWQEKVVRCGQGDQKWGLFYAEKPAQ